MWNVKELRAFHCLNQEVCLLALLFLLFYQQNWKSEWRCNLSIGRLLKENLKGVNIKYEQVLKGKYKKG